MRGRYYVEAGGRESVPAVDLPRRVRHVEAAPRVPRDRNPAPEPGHGAWAGLAHIGYGRAMFALAAVVTFALAFILDLLNVSTGNVSLLFLGLTFLAVHFLVGSGLTIPGR